MFLISRASLKKHNLLWLHRRGLPAAFLFTLTSIYALVAEEPERLGCCSLLCHLRFIYFAAEHQDTIISYYRLDVLQWSFDSP